MLKQRILIVLRAVFDPHGYLETGCRQEVGISMPSRPGDVEWSGAVADLIHGGLVSATPDAVTGDRRLKLTKKGETAARNL